MKCVVCWKLVRHRREEDEEGCSKWARGEKTASRSDGWTLGEVNMPAWHVYTQPVRYPSSARPLSRRREAKATRTYTRVSFVWQQELCPRFIPWIPQNFYARSPPRHDGVPYLHTSTRTRAYTAHHHCTASGLQGEEVQEAWPTLSRKRKIIQSLRLINARHYIRRVRKRVHVFWTTYEEFSNAVPSLQNPKEAFLYESFASFYISFSNIDIVVIFYFNGA